MVGFQTKLKHAEQTRIFRTIPGLENAAVRPARRPAPQHLHQLAELLDGELRLKATAPALRRPDHRRRGLCRKRRHRLARRPLRRRRSVGPHAGPAAAHHGPRRAPRPHHRRRRRQNFQPMNVNYGLFPPLPPEGKRDRPAPAAQEEPTANKHCRAGRWPMSRLGLKAQARHRRSNMPCIRAAVFRAKTRTNAQYTGG